METIETRPDPTQENLTLARSISKQSRKKQIYFDVNSKV